MKLTKEQMLKISNPIVKEEMILATTDVENPKEIIPALKKYFKMLVTQGFEGKGLTAMVFKSFYILEEKMKLEKNINEEDGK